MTGETDPLGHVRCLLGDITTQEIDVVVNAASEALRGGGGVDGAIHRAAGPGLLAELERLYPLGCRTGEVCPTGAHELRARRIFHAVGPIWRGGSAGEAALLAACYRSCVRLAVAEGWRGIAFPAISCGVYGYPAREAARVAFATLARELAGAPLEDVRFVLFSAELLEVYEGELERARAPEGA